jgi:hypothetical protein
LRVHAPRMRAHAFVETCTLPATRANHGAPPAQIDASRRRRHEHKAKVASKALRARFGLRAWATPVPVSRHLRNAAWRATAPPAGAVRLRSRSTMPGRGIALVGADKLLEGLAELHQAQAQCSTATRPPSREAAYRGSASGGGSAGRTRTGGGSPRGPRRAEGPPASRRGHAPSSAARLDERAACARDAARRSGEGVDAAEPLAEAWEQVQSGGEGMSRAEWNAVLSKVIARVEVGDTNLLFVPRVGEPVEWERRGLPPWSRDLATKPPRRRRSRW